ncbi:MAG: FAD-dependent oxidoreductase [Candidatus Brocadiia bacterium]|nr:FAD-dependent oxidoreductase [Candidatus Brocadiia bacterium]
MAETSTEKSSAVVFDSCETCRAACPVRTDTRAYVDLIAQGRYIEAFEKIRATNPFPSVCSLICHHPCEEKCRRQFVDTPVALRNLKRFAVEQALEHREAARVKAGITRTETVGVVGSGPAGLTVAHDCIKQGYAVTVYEALPRPGGMLACGIPKYRLPDDALQQDIDDITALGVEVRTGIRVGADVSLEDLRAQHDAAVIAVGLSESRDLPLENHDHPDVLLGIPFLRDTALGNPPEMKEHVLVIGGGNVAVDVARTAIRLGAKTVKMVCLESEDEVPAWDWERREALEEGIEFVYRLGPIGAAVEGGSVTGLDVREVERVFDEDGRFSPKYFDERTSTIPGGTVILAIGQQSDMGLVECSAVELDERGRLRFAPAGMTTSVPGVFACGEVVTGPGAAIEAVASGHRAAKAVMNYIETGESTVAEDDEVAEVGELPEDVIRNVQRIERLAMPTISAQERVKGFEQFELGYSEATALAEARRCLSCTAGAIVDKNKCAACLTCMRICPFGVPAVDDVAVMCSEMCQACGLCAVECPGLAISIKRFSVGDIRDRIVKLMQSSERQVTGVEIVCAQDATTSEDLQDRTCSMNGDLVARVPVTCAARAEEVDIMKAFELGAESVVVRRCAKCRYRGATDRLAKRVGRTQQILDAAGVGGDRLSLE